MAATSFDAAAAVAALSSNNNLQDPAAAPSFVFDIYDDGATRPTTNDAQLVPHQPQQQQQQQRQQHQQPFPSSVPSSSPALPDGACNFVDLSHGSSGVQCGCRRFWSRSNSIAATPATPSFGAFPSAGNINVNQAGSDTSQAGWCMCSHHACFHDHSPNNGSMSDRVSINTSFFTTGLAPTGTSTSFLEKSSPPQLLLPPSSTSVTGQENEQPRPNRVPLSPVLDHDKNGPQESNRDGPSLPDISFGLPSDVPDHVNASFFAMIHEAARESRDLIMASADVEVMEDEVPTEDEEAAADVITATPTPSVPPSVAVSVAGPPADHSIPDTLSWGPYGMSTRGDPSASAMGSTPAPNAHPGPLTSQQPPPSTTTSTSYTSQVRYMRPFAGKGLQTLTQAQPTPTPVSSGSPLKALLEQEPNTSSSRPLGAGILARVVEEHGARLNKLENPSFSASTASVTASFVATQAHEECLERHDHMDMRVTELESRIGEVERMQMNNDNDAATVTASSITSVSDAGAPLSTTTSITSRTPRTASAPDPAMLSRMKALEEHISLLEQSTLPSPTRPWQLEVVFLPFPLKGIWVEAVQFGPTEVVASAAAAQRRQSGAIPSYGDADGEDEWMQTIQQADTPRLLPRACVPGRNIDRRLRSRGLVQTVTVRGADANSIHTAMVVAFGAMLRVMASNNTRAAKGHCRSSSASLVSQFLGLQHSWVPLRKVHKQSRLRLLKCSEMVTPAVWDVNFMTASVVMKASGTHRLYVTQPAAYLQNREAYAHGWSWQKLRELPQVQVELENGSLGMDDACWAWDSKLDEPPAASTSESASSSSLSPLLIASRMHRPSPSPFSREGTPTGRTRAHRASSPSMLPTTTTAAAPIPAAPAGRSHSVSIGTSGSSEQFFTVAQSPMQQRVHQQHLHQTAPGATIPTASITLRRSLSPFFSSTPSAGRRVPPPIRTTSVPVPQQVASPAMMKGASSGAASRRRIHSAGSNHPATAISAPPLSAGINKRSRRCSTRSPSFGGHWPRNTPRYSRSPSMTPGPGAQNIALWATSDQHRSRQRRQSRQPEPQRARGTTPFAYATPFSTGADHFPPTSASSVDSGSGRRKRQRQERHERQFQYRRNSRHGSCGPLPAVLGHANNGQNYYDDEDMMVVGYDSDDVDDFDYPMTQEDEDDDNDDDADDIEVYEDEQDMLGLSNYDNNHQEEPGRQLLPKDQPRPGVEFDVEGFDVEGFDIEEFDDDDDDEDFIGHTFGAQHHHGSTQDTHDDEDESMSDSENMDPSISLFGDNNVEDEQPSQQQHQDQPGEDNRSDHSSQPSEYPSTRRPWRLGPVSAAVCEASTGHHHQQQLAVNDTEDRKHIIIDDTDIGFKIHEDGDASNL